MKQLFILLIAGVLSLPVSAGSSTGTIEWVRVRASDNLHYFRLTGNHVNKPACATSEAWSIKNENSAAAKSQIAILLAAWASGRKITVTGADACTRWVDIEDVNEIYIAP